MTGILLLLMKTIRDLFFNGGGPHPNERALYLGDGGLYLCCGALYPNIGGPYPKDGGPCPKEGGLYPNERALYLGDGGLYLCCGALYPNIGGPCPKERGPYPMKKIWFFVEGGLIKCFKNFNLKYRETTFARQFFPRVDYEACPNQVLTRICEFLKAI
jgi:hypothetical protein